MKRIFDLLVVIFLAFIIFIPLLIVSFLIKLDSKGPIFYISPRIGKNKKVFNMIKFRTMVKETPTINSNDLRNPDLYITRIGKFLRLLSIDEIPQIFNVFFGDMSLVGPRPALKNQISLIKKRDLCGINDILPGITGLAHINGIDMISLEEKVKFDLIYKNERNFILDLKILFKTIQVIFKKEGLKH